MLLAAAGGGAARAARRGEEGGRRKGRGEAPAHPDALGMDGEAGETATAEESAAAAAAGGGEEWGGGGAVERWGSIPRVRRERGGRGSWW